MRYVRYCWEKKKAVASYDGAPMVDEEQLLASVRSLIQLL
jgi:hypothetical protein